MKKNILCCDWGTSSFRLRLVDPENYEVLAELQSADGVAATFRSWQAESNSTNRFSLYASKLRTKIDELAQNSGLDLSGLPIIVSGMASSSIGMEEIPYADLPFAANGSQASAKLFADFNGRNIPLVLVSGVKSEDDVMRGEEAQMIGLFNLGSSFASKAIFVFPGTHSKHIFVENGNVTDFQTFMTGEIFNIISEHSILKDSITTGSESGIQDPQNTLAFKDGVMASGSSTLLHTLFSVRTKQLFSKLSKEQNAFYLSGLLIGTELRQLSDSSGAQLVICSGKHLYNHYKIAAEVLDLKENLTFIQPDVIDKATIAGQVQIFKALINLSNE